MQKYIYFLFFFICTLEQIEIAMTIVTAYDKVTKIWLDSLAIAYWVILL